MEAEHDTAAAAAGAAHIPNEGAAAPSVAAVRESAPIPQAAVCHAYMRQGIPPTTVTTAPQVAIQRPAARTVSQVRVSTPIPKEFDEGIYISPPSVIGAPVDTAMETSIPILMRTNAAFARFPSGSV